MGIHLRTHTLDATTRTTEQRRWVMDSIFLIIGYLVGGGVLLLIGVVILGITLLLLKMIWDIIRL